MNGAICPVEEVADWYLVDHIRPSDVFCLAHLH